MSFDALTLTGMFLLLLFFALVWYLCNREGMTCNDRSRHNDEGERDLARRKHP